MFQLVCDNKLRIKQTYTFALDVKEKKNFDYSMILKVLNKCLSLIKQGKFCNIRFKLDFFLFTTHHKRAPYALTVCFLVVAIFFNILYT